MFGDSFGLLSSGIEASDDHWFGGLDIDFEPLAEDESWVLQPRENVVKVDDVRHTHDSISKKFACGKSFDELIGSLDRGRIDPLKDTFLKFEVVERLGQGLFSINNRRLFCLELHQEHVRRSRLVMVRVRISMLQASFGELHRNPICEQFIRAYDSFDAGRGIMVRGDRRYDWRLCAVPECAQKTGIILSWNWQKQFGFVSYHSEKLFLNATYIVDADECRSAQRRGLAEGDRIAFDPIQHEP